MAADIVRRGGIDTGKARGKNYTADLINSQVIPSYDETIFPAVRDYRRLMDRWRNHPERLLPPRDVLPQDYEPPRYSFISFEGYLNARLNPDTPARKLGKNGYIRTRVLKGADWLSHAEDFTAGTYKIRFCRTVVIENQPPVDQPLSATVWIV